MEYIGQKTMFHYLKDKPGRKVSEDVGRIIFKQIVSAVAYLHSKNIAHRDIKLENIMIGKNKQIKLIDFGFSVTCKEGKNIRIICGTPSYMAPELTLKKDYDGKKVDVWALGIIVFVMCAGFYPFRGKNP